MSDDAIESGVHMLRLIERLFPICRSITGNGVRETLQIIRQHLPLDVHEVPSGTQVLDWRVPDEWNIRGAHITDPAGRRVIDFADCNLHVVSYSEPINRTMTLAELRPHLHTLPDHPDLIPYRTTYYSRTWGFCLAERIASTLVEGEYQVVIDSTIAPGSLTYGECVIPGELDDEIVISTHVCHPSLCDDNLSGVAVAVALASEFIKQPPRHTIRFIFAPGTIGAITWLANNRAVVPRIAAGLTLTCLGDEHPFTYKRTERANTLIDRAAELVLADLSDSQFIDFFPYGYDERQYNSPGFRAPVGSLMRGRHGEFPEYHTSADNLGFIRPDRLTESLTVLRRLVVIADNDRTMLNLQPFGEPQLGSRGLYTALGGLDVADAQLAMLWVLNQSDGHTSLVDIALRSGLAFESIAEASRVLEDHGLLGVAPGSVAPLS